MICHMENTAYYKSTQASQMSLTYVPIANRIGSNANEGKPSLRFGHEIIGVS
jgi:hypothetical protein